MPTNEEIIYITPLINLKNCIMYKNIEPSLLHQVMSDCQPFNYLYGTTKNYYSELQTTYVIISYEQQNILVKRMQELFKLPMLGVHTVFLGVLKYYEEEPLMSIENSNRFVLGGA